MLRKRADIEIVPDRAEYAFGDVVRAAVRIDVRRHTDVRKGMVELVCRHQYRYTSSSTDSDGRSSSTTRWGADDRTVAEQPVLGSGSVRAGDVVEHTVGLPLPPDSAPSGRGSVTVVIWEVRARLQARLALDPKNAAEIVVRGRPLDPRASAQLPVLQHERSTDMAIELPEGRSVARGSRLTGVLTMTPREDVAARRVRLRLERSESVHHYGGDTARDVVAKAVLADGLGRLTRGRSHRFPFDVQVPVDTCPSLATKTATVRWLLVGEVERRLRRDDEMGLELHVY